MQSPTEGVATADDANAEQAWMRWMKDQPDPLPPLRIFAGNYHYFSLNQVIAFSQLFRVLGPTDRESLAMLADVLHEELGRNDSSRVHSVLFERFAAAIGVDSGRLPWPEGDVAQGVRDYVDALVAAFGGASLPRALATLQFLESSAVETYGPMLAMLRSFGISEGALEFFRIHAEVEVEHAAMADALVRRAGFGAVERGAFEGQSERLRAIWQRMWTDILLACRAVAVDA